MISSLINTIHTYQPMLLLLIRSILSMVISVLVVNGLLVMIKTLRPVVVKAKQEKEKKQTENPFAKKRRHIRFEEKDTRTTQRIKLSKDGICYRVGDYNLSPAMYDLVLKPVFGLITMLVFLVVERHFSLFLIPMFIFGYAGIPLILKNRGKQDERQIEWDIYKALTNVRLQLACGAYLEDCLQMAARGAIHPRFKEAMDELLANMKDKTKTTAESIEILKTRFSSERMMTFCKIMDSMIAYGSLDNIYEDMNKELEDMIRVSSERSVGDIRHRYQFSSGWMSMVIFIIVLMYFNLLFSDNAVINSGIAKVVISFNDALGGKIF